MPPVIYNHPDIYIKVTKINDRWHARLFSPTGEILDEMACSQRKDVGSICRIMLRWHDKLGGMSKYADWSRHRQEPNPISGRIWYRPQLKYEVELRSCKNLSQIQT